MVPVLLYTNSEFSFIWKATIDLLRKYLPINTTVYWCCDDLLEFAYQDDGKQFIGEVQYFEKFGSFGVVIDKAFETFQDLIEYDQFFNVVGNIFEK
jgi:hypothetical protein